MTDGLHEHDRPADLVLARVHLRLGSLALARAELETLAGRDELDPDGLVDLAEARWRTGDLEGAGEAAAAALHDEDGPLLALIVAAEAAAARGRPSEARRLAERALAATGGAIDPIFAGMPRAPVWPPDAAAPAPAPTTLFGPPHGPAVDAGERGSEPAGTPDAAAGEDGSEDDRTSTIALWDAEALADDDGTGRSGTDRDAGVDAPDGDASDLVDGARGQGFEPTAAPADLPFGDEELERARVALADGDVGRAAVHLAFVLRLTPALASIVVELVGTRREPGLAFVRGDAYRLVGRETEALHAFADAARPDTELPGPDDISGGADPAPTEPNEPTEAAGPERSEGDPA